MTHHLSINTFGKDAGLKSHRLHLRYSCSAHVPCLSSCWILFSLTFFLCAFCISDCWLFQQKPMIEMIKLNFFCVFFLFVLSFEVVFIPFNRCNSLGLSNFGFRVLLLCMQSLLCWHCFSILVFSNFSVPCTTDDHLYGYECKPRGVKNGGDGQTKNMRP